MGLAEVINVKRNGLMRVLVVGGGGREHALIWKIAQSPLVSRVFCAPGNAGTASVAENVLLEPTDLDSLAAFAEKERIDLTVAGPEAPLVAGIADFFAVRGLKVFGPAKDAARLEGSKVFAKELMRKYRIPTAPFEVFDAAGEAVSYIRKRGAPVVVKADGLAAGKGVIVCQTDKEAFDAVNLVMEEKAFGAAGDRVVIEDLLRGEEASYIVLTDGEKVIPMLPAQDHKAVFDGDAGPNTGGMGAYSPAPVVSAEVEERIIDEVMRPAVRAMASEGIRYRGALYAGLMILDGRPWVLEFNVRMGDPETQPVLMLMESDLVPLMLVVAEGELGKDVELKWSPGASVCVVMASAGYPGQYERGHEILGLEEAAGIEDVEVFQAGTRLEGGKVVTAGGRVLGVTAKGDDIRAAVEKAYSAVNRIRWQGAHYRKDIGRKALERGNS